MELLQLRYFLVTAKYEHMTKAANALRIAQPALSQSIKRLEQELGVTLFDREKRGIRLNENGEFLKKQITPILETLDELPAALQENANQQLHTIHLNILAASRLITDCIIEYKQLHPEVNFRLHQKTDHEQADVSITTISPGEPLPENSRRILKETFFLAVPANSAYAKQDFIFLSEMKEEGFINLSSNRPIRRICERFCLDSGFTPRTVGESDNPETIRNLIAAGLGVSFWPEYSWKLLSNENIALLPIKQPTCERDIILTVRPDHISKNVLEDFCQYLSEYTKREDVRQSSR